MAKQISIVPTESERGEMFKEFCKVKGLKSGDKFYTIDYVDWTDDYWSCNGAYFNGKKHAQKEGVEG